MALFCPYEPASEPVALAPKPHLRNLCRARGQERLLNIPYRHATAPDTRLEVRLSLSICSEPSLQATCCPLTQARGRFHRGLGRSVLADRRWTCRARRMEVITRENLVRRSTLTKMFGRQRSRMPFSGTKRSERTNLARSGFSEWMLTCRRSDELIPAPVGNVQLACWLRYRADWGRSASPPATSSLGGPATTTSAVHTTRHR